MLEMAIRFYINISMKYWCERALKKKQFEYLAIDTKRANIQIELMNEQKEHLKWERELMTKKYEEEHCCTKEEHSIKMKLHRLTEVKLKRDLGLLVDDPPAM